MRTIGIDWAIVGDHKAVIHDNQGEVVGKVFSLRTELSSLDELLRRAREGVAEDEPLRVVMEPTGLAWLSVASLPDSSAQSWSCPPARLHPRNTQRDNPGC